MSKKVNTNTKDVQAKARKYDKKKSEIEVQQKKLDDEYWRDDDKHVNKKALRKEDRDLKRVQQLEKKKELQDLHDKEMNSINMKKEPTVKVTHFQVEEMKRKTNEAAVIKKTKFAKEPIHENLNRIICDADEARNIDEALKMFNLEEKPDRNPEKRIKVAYKYFKEKRLPELKVENPTLKLSQLKQMLSKEFEKSSQNPKNKTPVSAYFKA